MQTMTFRKIIPKDKNHNKNSFVKTRKKCMRCKEIFYPKYSGTLLCEKCIKEGDKHGKI